MTAIVKARRGALATMPALDEGELGYTIDERALYVGGASGQNTRIGPDSFDPASLADRLASGDLALISASVDWHEFDLALIDGVYYLAYDTHSGLETRLRHASTVAGLASASDEQTISTHYPSILFDGTTWHLWGVVLSTTWHLQHYTAAAWAGPYSLIDTTSLDTFDPQVRRSPLDGMYYCAYGRYLVTEGVTPANVGLLQASSPAGPWTDLGYIFSEIGNPAWAPNQYDPTPIFWGGRAYVVFSCGQNDGTETKLGMVELQPSTMKAVAPATILLDDTRSGGGDFQNAIWVADPDAPGREILYVNDRPGFSALTVSSMPQTAITGLTDSNLADDAAIALTKLAQTGAQVGGTMTWNGTAWAPYVRSELLVQDGSSSPPVALWTEDGTDFIQTG